MALHTVESSSPDDIYKQAAERIAKDIEFHMHTKSNCILGIVGGRTVHGLFSALAKKSFEGTLHVFWLDERVSGEKNYRQSKPYLQQMRNSLNKVHWHPFQGADETTVQQEATEILRKIKDIRGKSEFDVVICSSGEDGHIASIFPESRLFSSNTLGYVVVKDAPKPPAERVTVTPKLLLTAKSGHLLFIGDKRTAYSNFLDARARMRYSPNKLMNRLPELTVYVSLR